MREIDIILLFVLINLVIYFSYSNISKFINIYDIPNVRKIHKTKTPLIGGVIFLLNILFFYFFFNFNFFRNLILNDPLLSNTNFVLLFFASVSIFILGIVDDKFDINPNLKLFLLSIIIFVFLYFDNSIIITELRFSFLNDNIHIGKYSYFFSILCFLLFINACNMFDGINLQSSSYFLIYILTLSILTNQNILFFIIIISLINLCILNYKGKIFMGDSGIYLFSFILGYLIIKTYNYEILKNADSVFIIMLVPGIDMLRLFIIRILNKKNPFRPDMLHIHHLLVKKYKYKVSIIFLNLIILIPIISMYLKINSLFIILTYAISYLILMRFLKKDL